MGCERFIFAIFKQKPSISNLCENKYINQKSYFPKPSISSFSENPEMKIKNAQLGRGKERFFIAVSSTNPKKS